MASGSVALLAPALAGAADVASGGDATIFAGTYKRSVYVINESDFEKRNEIPLTVGIPYQFAMSPDLSRLYVQSADMERFDVIDVGSEKVIDSFSLQDGNTHIKAWSTVIEPSNRYALFITKATTRHRDRFEIGPPKLLRYDLRKHEVSAEIPWPDETEREFAGMLFSPDGKSVFFLAEEIVVFDAETFEEIDRWEYSRSLDEGLGPFPLTFPRRAFGGGAFYDEPGIYTGLFRFTDPVQNRPMMGVAKVDLARRDVDFTMLGPSEPVSFALAPDRKKAYGLHHEVGNYQMWTFDLEGGKVESRVEFEGRPRMSVMVSSNGKLLYIYRAGHTFDIYKAADFSFLRTVELDADMFQVVMLPPA